METPAFFFHRTALHGKKIDKRKETHIQTDSQVREMRFSDRMIISNVEEIDLFYCKRVLLSTETWLCGKGEANTRRSH